MKHGTVMNLIRPFGFSFSSGNKPEKRIGTRTVIDMNTLRTVRKRLDRTDTRAYGLAWDAPYLRGVGFDVFLAHEVVRISRSSISCLPTPVAGCQ